MITAGDISKSIRDELTLRYTDVLRCERLSDKIRVRSTSKPGTITVYIDIKDRTIKNLEVSKMVDKYRHLADTHTVIFVSGGLIEW